MDNLTTVADVRALDRLYLETIGGSDYYEVRQIVKEDGGRRVVVGLASEWPVISRDALVRELTALLTASEERSANADCHVAELICRIGVYEEHIAALEVALATVELLPALPDVAAVQVPEAPPARSDGKVACDWPGCEDRVKPKGLRMHRHRKHGAQQPTFDAPPAPPWACASCGATTGQAIGDPTRCKTCLRTSMPVVVAPGDVADIRPPWSCAGCGSDTHTRSLSDPARCMRCAADAIATNGHLVTA